MLVTTEKRDAKLPFLLRCKIYAYIELLPLINKICKLSKKEHNELNLKNVKLSELAHKTFDNID